MADPSQPTGTPPTQTDDQIRSQHFKAGDIVRLPHWKVGQGNLVLGTVEHREGLCLCLRVGPENGLCLAAGEAVYLAEGFEKMTPEEGAHLRGIEIRSSR